MTRFLLAGGAAPPRGRGRRARAGRRLAATASILAGALGFALPALAGPPYVTDDPEPTDTGHWENYAYTQGIAAGPLISGQVGADLNYGAARDLQLTAIVVEDYVAERGLRGGFGQLQLAAKYRFIHQDDHGWLPDVSVFPQINLPTTNRYFGAPKTGWFLPVWMEKDFGAWSLFGGGGYTFNPGPGNRNYWISGLALTRKVAETLALGVEVYDETPPVAGQKELVNLGVGFQWQAAKHLALIGSGGPSLKNPAGAQQGAYYLGLLFTY